MTVEPYPHALAGITRNLAFVFNTRTTWGVLQGVESGDCEDERKLHQVVEALRAAMLAAVRQYEPRLVGPQVEMRGHHGNRVRFEVHGLVEGKACAIDVDIHSVTGRADVAEVAS